MKLGISKNADINYLAKVVNIETFTPHSDPEVNKLKCCNIDGFNIICGIESEPGTYVYFPALSQLNPQFLSYCNLYRKKELNNDPTQSGMFEDNGRVKAIKLRGEISEGFILPMTVVENFIMSVTNKEVNYNINDEFDSVIDGNKSFWINKKYVAPIVTRRHNNNTPKEHKNNKKQLDKVIDTQFKFHYDTIQIKKCPNVIKPDDYIHISSKVHGTSAISAYVMCHKELNWKEKIAKFLTKNPFDIYDYLYSSRSVIKNRKYNKKSNGGFYGVDVWEYGDAVIRPHLEKGMTVYYEIIGFLPTNNYIQKGFDYGYRQRKSDEDYKYNVHFGIRVYRVTITNVDGCVHEFSPREVQIWATEHDLVPVTEFYYGKAKDLYPELSTTEHWTENFINKLSNDPNFYMELDSPECIKPAPHEGIVIKIDNSKSIAFKLKCFKFLNKEQKELDNGTENIEDNA